MKLTLQTFTTPMCTIGKFYDDKNNQICVTMEKPYLDNQKDISCVPPGLYDLLPRKSPTQGNTYYLSNPKLNVSLNDQAGRTYIQIHVANRASQLKGCIAPGTGFGHYAGEWAVYFSAIAKVKLMRLLNGDKHKLEIFRI